MSRHLKSLSPNEQLDLMGLMGYQVHHWLPVDMFDLSRAFREYCEYIDPELRLLFNTEAGIGKSPQESMQNGLLVLQKRIVSDKTTYGVHTNHLAYTEALARYVDLREGYLRKRATEKLEGDGVIPTTAEIASEARLALAAEIPEITRVLKERILRESVIGTQGGFKEINDLFGQDYRKLKDEPFLQQMNVYFGLR